MICSNSILTKICKAKTQLFIFAFGNRFECFLSIVLLGGYNFLLQEWLCWSNDDDVGVNLVKKKMSCNMFQEIKRHFHLADTVTIIWLKTIN